MKRWLLLTCLLAACQPPPFVPLQYYTRTEMFHLERARWLHAHCDLIRLRHTFTYGRADGSLFSPPTRVADLGDYAQLVGVGHVTVTGVAGTPALQSLVYSCDEPTPWTPEDPPMVAIDRRHQLAAGVPFACPEDDPARPRAEFTVLDPGEGTAPTTASYVSYRVTPVVVIPPGGEDDARAHGVVAGPRRSSVIANHVLCASFRDALLALKPGGRAHVTLTFGSDRFTFEKSPAWPEVSPLYQWDVELLEVGGVDLLYHHVGLTADGAPDPAAR